MTQPATTSELHPLRRVGGLLLFVTLGYFVDVFDLLLFAVVRVPSVRDLGAGSDPVEVGALLPSAQLLGLMIGGLVWGRLGDRRGRRAALYGSIALYSVANLANAVVTTITAYAVWRFIAGFGLVGELGAGLTLVFLTGAADTPVAFYALCGWLGFSAGYWAVMVTMAVEQFGTDLRATAATSVPTFVRASAVPMTLAFLALRPTLGMAPAAGLIGALAFGIASWALWRQPETYGRDLDFIEEDVVTAIPSATSDACRS